MRHNESDSKKPEIFSKQQILLILLGSATKAASVPPTQPFMVWMKQSQSNLHLGTLDVLKLTYQRGVMTGWQIGALREFFKGFSKFFGISLANSIIPKEIEVSDNTKVNTLASAAQKY